MSAPTLQLRSFDLNFIRAIGGTAFDDTPFDGGRDRAGTRTPRSDRGGPAGSGCPRR